MSEIEVKALEWSAEANGEYVAVSVIGWFHIGRPASYWNLTTPHGLVSSYETLDAAKAAAQSDFASRIRSCLLDKPEAVEGERQIRKAGQVAIDGIIDGWSDRTIMPDSDDLAEYLTRIVDACVRAALSASPSPVDSRDGLIKRLVTPHSYAQEYEFRGDGGDYVPTDGERTMIEDAICGYLGELAEARAALAAKEQQP